MPAQLTAKEADLKRAELSASVPVTETGNIISTQASTTIAASSSLISDLPDDHNHIDASFTATEDKEIGMGLGLGLSFITSVIWYIRYYNLHKNKTPDEQIKEFDKLKLESGYWQRSVKTYAQLGMNSSSGSFDLVTELLFFLPTWLKLPLKLAITAIVGTLFGIVAGTIAFFRNKNNNSIKSTDKRDIFLIGRDDSSRYTKTGGRAGAYLGPVIGGMLSIFLPFPGGIVIGMAMGAALGYVFGFLLSALLVPLINKIRFTFFPKKQKSPPTEKEKDTKPHPKHSYRINYINQGMAAGGAIGVIVGFIISLCIPIPGSTAFFMAICAAIGAVICGGLFAIVGPIITKAVSERDRKGYSSWDYDARTGFSLGNQNGLGIATYGMLSAFGIGSALNGLKDFICSIGGLIVGFIFSAYSANEGKKRYSWSEKKFNENKPLVPRSQVLATFGAMGGFAGSVLGFTIGLIFFGPPGAILFAMVGTGFGALIGAGVALVGGETIYLKYLELSKFLAEKFTVLKSKIEEWFGVPQPKKIPTKVEDESESEQVDLSLSDEEPEIESETEFKSTIIEKSTKTTTNKSKKKLDEITVSDKPCAFPYAGKKGASSLQHQKDNTLWNRERRSGMVNS